MEIIFNAKKLPEQTTLLVYRPNINTRFEISLYDTRENLP
jgi:hypothetical protein